MVDLNLRGGAGTLAVDILLTRKGSLPRNEALFPKLGSGRRRWDSYPRRLGAAAQFVKPQA